MPIRHDACDRFAGQFLKLRQTGAQNFHIAPKLVDDERTDTRLLVWLEQLNRTIERREHTAAVDITHQQHRRVHQLCQSHIDDIVFL